MPFFHSHCVWVRKHCSSFNLFLSFTIWQTIKKKKKERKKARTVSQSQVSAVCLVNLACVSLIGGATPLWNGTANPPRRIHTHAEETEKRFHKMDIPPFDFHTFFLSLMVNLTSDHTHQTTKLSLSKRRPLCKQPYAERKSLTDTTARQQHTLTGGENCYSQ